MEDVLLGIDLGTSCVKAALYTLEGQSLGISRMDVPMVRSQVGHYEQNPDTWWELVRQILKELFTHSAVTPDAVRVVGVCGQSHGPTPFSSGGKAIANCITWQDQRGREEVNWILKNVGDQRIIAEGNLPVDTCYTAPKLMWLKRNHCEIYEKTYKFLLPKDVINYRLTGEFSTDITDASVTNMFNQRSLNWSEALLSAYQLEIDKLPKVYKPWDVIGEVTQHAAAETGLKKGTPVIAGAADWASVYYGGGGIKPGVVIDLTGTVGGIIVTSYETLPFPGLLSIIPGLRNYMAGTIEASAAIYEWYRSQFYKCSCNKEISQPTFEEIDAQAARIPPGSNGIIVMPYFAGARRPEKENLKGSIVGLTLQTRRAELARAIMEGVAYETRRAIDRVRGVGIPCRNVRTVGGAARSSLWRQIKADVTGAVYQKLNLEEVGTFGIAMLGGFAIGVFNTLEEPIIKFVNITGEVVPDPSRARLYGSLYKAYCTLAEILEESGIYDALDAVTMGLDNKRAESSLNRYKKEE